MSKSVINSQQVISSSGTPYTSVSIAYGGAATNGYPTGVYDTRNFTKEQFLKLFQELEQYPEAAKALEIYNSKLYKVMK